MKPFLVKDTSNNISLFCFINSLFLIFIFEPNKYVEGILLSINAACVFHYFVIILPSEKRKLVVSREIGIAIQNLKDRDGLLYSLLNYQPILVNNCEYEVHRLLEKLKSAMNVPIECEPKKHMFFKPNDPFTPYFVNPGGDFNVLWEQMVEWDRQFLVRMFSLDLSFYPELAVTLNTFHQQYCYFIGADQKQLDKQAVSYLTWRKHLIAVYTNSAGHYYYGWESRFKNY
ncbi:hypothetical protein [Vibrio sp. B1FLJ16]|uniref:hypothetical protein n=1 Tax=Vibrio sp. B1FLJ16 TaxID=2751178 RepID=UPI0015F72F13|nr:hypothetical protein [Vibrio sp. B1FLJ16]